MSNFIEKSVQEIFDESMANAFIREKVEPVVEVEETFRSTLASRMETDRQEKYEEEQRLIEIEEKKMYKGENATTSAEKNKEIVEKSVKNTITINPDIKETIVGKIYAAYNDRYLAEKKAKKDYDGDGKVESGAKEYRGVIHNKIQQKRGGKADGKDTSSVKEGMATPESGTGKYYKEGKPTAMQMAKREKMKKIKDLTKDIKIPWFAIGGINKVNISSLKNHGIKKVAVISGLLNSEDPKEEAIIILKELSHEN